MKRKDKKGRVLKENELQRPDGRYEYRYRALDGSKKSVYSWRLTESDSTPPGKKKELSLRELEQKILKDNTDGISYEEKQTLNERWELNIESRTLKSTTKNNYLYMYDLHVRNTIGNLQIKNITFTAMRKFLNDRITIDGNKASSVSIYHKMLHPVFEDAVRDGIIRTNPMKGLLSEINKKYNQKIKSKHPLSKDQTKKFLDFIKTDKTYSHYYNMFLCLFGTGCRIGEFLGLIWDDIDWKENLITIDHSLIYKPQRDRKMKVLITKPKTTESNRKIPMLPNVREAFRSEYEHQKENGFCTLEIDGYSGFIWTTKSGNIKHPSNFNDIISNIVKKYNKKEENEAKKENREPVLLPKFSAHICRHTFCTRLCEQETDLKIIQEIMGHSRISTTMDIYNEANIERKVVSFKKLGDLIV